MKSNNKNKTENKSLDSNGIIQIPWHPAFVEALQLELEAYKDVLEFHSELQLTTEPLRIDCVVIKKVKEVEIKKNIGKIFRTWNIIEYKSPDDYVSVDDYYKVYGYACIYASLNKIPITDITITFVESHHPRELIRHLNKIRGFTIVETYSGVYNVYGDIMPMQIIDNRQLSAKDNIWLKNLSNRLNHTDVEQISIKIAQQGKSAQIKAYAYAIANAYAKKIKENLMASGVTFEYERAFRKEVTEFYISLGLVPYWEENAKAEFASVIAEKEAENALLRAQIAELQKRLLP